MKIPALSPVAKSAPAACNWMATDFVPAYEPARLSAVGTAVVLVPALRVEVSASEIDLTNVRSSLHYPSRHQQR